MKVVFDPFKQSRMGPIFACWCVKVIELAPAEKIKSPVTCGCVVAKIKLKCREMYSVTQPSLPNVLHSIKSIIIIERDLLYTLDSM